MLNQTQKAAVSALVSGIRHALKKGKALRDEMTKLQTPEALISFVEDFRAEVKETVSDKELAARSMALVSTIASQLRRDKDWPKVRKAGAGRPKSDKSDEQDKVPCNETAAEGMIAAVAYIIRRHREIPKAELAKVLEPLTNVIRYATSK